VTHGRRLETPLDLDLDLETPLDLDLETPLDLDLETPLDLDLNPARRPSKPCHMSGGFQPAREALELDINRLRLWGIDIGGPAFSIFHALTHTHTHTHTHTIHTLTLVCQSLKRRTLSSPQGPMALPQP